MSEDLQGQALFTQGFVGQQLDFHKSQAPVRFCFAGNRSGKTNCGAREAAMWLTHTHPFREIPDRPIKGWCICLDRDTAIDILIPKVLDFIPTDLLARNAVVKGDVPEIRLRTGDVLRFKSAASGRTKFQSAAIDFAWGDEEFPEDIYDETLMRLIDRGGSFWGTLTPLKGKTWLYYRYAYPWENSQLDPDEVQIFRWSIKDNVKSKGGALDEEEVDRILANIPDHMRPARERGEFIDLTGLIWPQFSRNHHMVEPFEIPKHWPVGAALDPGYGHPFGMTAFTVTDRGDMIVIGEYNRNHLTCRDHCRNIIKVFKTCAPHVVDEKLEDALFNLADNDERLSKYRGLRVLRDVRLSIDPSAMQMSREMNRYGMFPNMAKREVIPGLNLVGEMLQKSLNDSPGGLYFMVGRTRVHIDQVTGYSWRDGYEGEKPQNREDDCCDTLRYSAEMRLRPPGQSNTAPARGTMDWYDQISEGKDALRQIRGNENVPDHKLEEFAESLVGGVGFGRAF